MKTLIAHVDPWYLPWLSHRSDWWCRNLWNQSKPMLWHKKSALIRIYCIHNIFQTTVEDVVTVWSCTHKTLKSLTRNLKHLLAKCRLPQSRVEDYNNEETNNNVLAFIQEELASSADMIKFRGPPNDKRYNQFTIGQLLRSKILLIVCFQIEPYTISQKLVIKIQDTISGCAE